MESIKNIFFIIGVAVTFGSIYGVITFFLGFFLDKWLNRDFTDDANTFLGSWIIGGILFIVMTILWIRALGII